MKTSEAIKLLETLSHKKVSLLERSSDMISDSNTITFHEVLDQQKVHIFGLENIDAHLINRDFDVDEVSLPIKWRISFDFKKAGINGYSVAAKVGTIHIALNIWGNGTTDDETKEADLDLSQFELDTHLEFREGGTMYLDQVNIDFKTKKITVE